MQTPGAIGYVEYGYAKLTGTAMATLENAAGKFVAPGGEGGAAALASAKFDDRMRAFITDPEGDDAYPIATFTWMLFYEHGQDPAKVEGLKKMVEYALTDGQAMAGDLDLEWAKRVARHREERLAADQFDQSAIVAIAHTGRGVRVQGHGRAVLEGDQPDLAPLGGLGARRMQGHGEAGHAGGGAGPAP